MVGMRLSALRSLYCFVVIAGLDPAIHAAKKPIGIF
jgi:hypothetical protein